jgi:hypothetical protein
MVGKDEVKGAFPQRFLEFLAGGNLHYFAGQAAFAEKGFHQGREMRLVLQVQDA